MGERRCRRCGAAWTDPRARYCGRCGAPLPGADAARAAPARSTRGHALLVAVTLAAIGVGVAFTVSVDDTRAPRGEGVTLPDRVDAAPDRSPPRDPAPRPSCRPAGCERWHVELDDGRVVAHAGLLVVIGQEQLMGIEAHTGHLRWQRDLPEPWASPLGQPVEVLGAGDDAMVVQGAGRMELRGTGSGMPRWSHDLGGRRIGELAVRGDLLVLAGRALDASAEPEAGFVGGWTLGRGTRRWQVELDEGTDAVVLEEVVVVRRPDALELLDPATGQLTAVILTQGPAAVEQVGPWLLVVGRDGAWLHHPDDGTMVTALDRRPVASVGLEDGAVVASVPDDGAGRVLLTRLAEDADARWTAWLGADWGPELELEVLPGTDRVRLTDTRDPLRSTDLSLTTGWVLDHRRIEPIVSEADLRVRDLTTGEEYELRYTPDLDVRVVGPLTLQRSDDVLRIEGPAGLIDVEGGRELLSSTPLVVWTEDGLMGLAGELVGLEP